MERPRIRAYSRETVIAEKFEAMIALSEANSRMKDLYDIFALSRMFDFDGIVLRESIRSTLTRRATPLAPLPAVFTTTFSKAKEKQAQWRAFQKRIKVAEAVELQDVLERIREFLQPVYLKILAGEDWKMHWNSTHSQWE
jgi:predicted nucleotidyltransferase component of viral defense system